MNKILLLFAITLVIASIGCIDENVWDGTYTSFSNGIYIEYPTNWVSGAVEQDNSYGIVIIRKDPSSGVNLNVIEETLGPHEFDFEEVIGMTAEELENVLDATIIDTQVIGNEAIIEYTFNAYDAIGGYSGDLHTKQKIVICGEKYYTCTVLSSEELYSSFEDKFNHIISSFRCN